MVYSVLFMVRYFPFWAVPLALIFFELGVYHYNRRERSGTLTFFGAAAFLVIVTILWIVFEGYWRAGPWIKQFIEG